MPKISEEFSSNYVKTDELERDTTFTIETVEIVEFKEDDGTKKKKVVIQFAGRDKKKLVCNATRRELMVELFGDDTEDWEGQKIVLFRDKTMYAGKRVDTIGIKEWRPRTPDRRDEPEPNRHPAGNGTKLPPAPISQLIETQLTRLRSAFQAEFPAATTELPNSHIVARHLYRVAGEAGLLMPEPNLKSGDVFRRLRELEEASGSDRKFLADELRRYLPGKFEEAKQRATFEALDEAGSGDEGDPHDVEYPDEPGMRG